MMDIKDIIKWFLQSFNCSTCNNLKMDTNLTFICLILYFSTIFAAKLPISDSKQLVINSVTQITKNNFNEFSVDSVKRNQSQRYVSSSDPRTVNLTTSIGHGRTFGRPFKKMMQAILPLVFHMGAAATWSVVSALVGLKTFAISLIILKLLLMAGAAKIGALFAQKAHHVPAKWEPPSKEIHVHIHNGYHQDEHVPVGPWSREGQIVGDPKPVNVVYDTYPGPQTISTPYGNYVRIDPVVQGGQVQ